MLISRFETIADMRNWRGSLSQTEVVGFVPTLGALHEGHATLLRKMRSRCDRLVLSIFVNPTQFGPTEDLVKYPRPLKQDLEIAHLCGVDAVFTPTPAQIYPAGFSTFVEESSLTLPLCGPFRPGHFRGVTTVVMKLIQVVKPHVAYFGIKDAQQFFVLQKMAEDLNLDVSVEAVATVRENDGLALSSRNAYLSAEQRSQATFIHQILLEIREKLAVDFLNYKQSLDLGRVALEGAGFRVQYLELLKAPDLTSLVSNESPLPDHPYLLAVAAYLGSTRLIDNLILNERSLFLKHGIRIHAV